MITNDRIKVGDYTMYNDFVHDPQEFEKNNVLYHYPVNGEQLQIGKFCSIACGAKFLFISANHAMSSLLTYPFPKFFKEPFWVGVFERVSDGRLSVRKVMFGAEPGCNPKRVQREVRKQVQNTGIGIKSQRALKLQQGQLKTERKIVSREQREAKLELVVLGKVILWVPLQRSRAKEKIMYVGYRVERIFI